jgi:hypothetical protein
VLAGAPDRDDLLLSAPVLLGDHPRIAIREAEAS